ncbi:MAG TPA: mercuric reductase [Thermomicrobiales bacterium]|nr:mercuric reductase [Thermomicrobiales bacterium]
MTTVDVVIIGSGQAGGPLAVAFAAAGKQAVLIERDQLGGTCVNVGCTPTKTMIASGRVAYLARRADDYGVDTGQVAVDMRQVRQRKRDVVKQWRSGSEKMLLGKENPRVVFGEARFAGVHDVTVALNGGGEETFHADTIVIDAGSRPRTLDVPGADTVDVLDSTSVMELDEVPEHLIVVGGGAIGLEFAQLFRRLGAAVTIVQRGPHLLSGEDDDIAQAVQSVLEEDGIDVLLNARPSRVSGEGGTIALEVKRGDEFRTVSGSHLLATAGRLPNTEELALDAAGVEMDERGYIPTNDRLETNVPGIYAVGDIRGGPKFTHISYDDYRVLKENLIDGGTRSIEGRMVPYTVFIDPQLGRIGMTEQQARKDGRDIRVASMPMSSVARAVETDEPRGVMKAVVDAGSGQVLGAAVLGLEGGEIASMLQIAMMGQVPYTVLRDGIFPHPGLAESLNNLFGSFQDEEG